MRLHIRRSRVKKKKQGFRARMKTKSGRNMINRRRRKGKKKATAWN